MNKISEVESSLIVYALVIVVIAFGLIFSLGGIKSVKNVQNKFEINSFVDTLQNSLKAQAVKSYGSVDTVSFSVPSDIESVCFIDESERFSPETVLGLSQEKQIYQDSNLFFFPKGRFSPAKISYIKLNQSENPLCISSVSGKLDIKLTSVGNSALVEAANEQNFVKDCVIVPGSSLGDSDNKIDIVFLGYGYNNNTLFSEQVIDYVQNYFLKTEPFLSNKDKFNIWMVDQGQPNCSISSYIFCESLTVNRLASNCPNDYIFILVDPRLLRTSIRSSAISNMAKINTKDNNLVMLHEFAHIFANLADEYTDTYYDSWFDARNYPNCDYANCNKWSSIDGALCLRGCSTKEFYRSVDFSIMKDYDRSNSFGVLNEKVISDNLGDYK